MKKYCIINKTFFAPRVQIMCRAKNYGRYYRQGIESIDDALVIYETTLGRANSMKEYLTQEYYEGWEVVDTEEFYKNYTPKFVHID